MKLYTQHITLPSSLWRDKWRNWKGHNTRFTSLGSRWTRRCCWLLWKEEKTLFIVVSKIKLFTDDTIQLYEKRRKLLFHLWIISSSFHPLLSSSFTRLPRPFVQVLAVRRDLYTKSINPLLWDHFSFRCCTHTRVVSILKGRSEIDIHNVRKCMVCYSQVGWDIW